MVKHGGHHGISYLFIALTRSNLNSMTAPLSLKSCEDHSLLKSYNGGLWKNNYRSGPFTKYLLWYFLMSPNTNGLFHPSGFNILMKQPKTFCATIRNFHGHTSDAFARF